MSGGKFKAYSFSEQLILVFCRLGVVGLSPLGPGTAGSLLAVILAPFLFLPLPWFWRVFVLLIIFFLGSLAASRAEKILGRKDPKEVVIDELLGQWIAVLPIVPGQDFLSTANIFLMLTGFVLFRFFDILKPFPIKQAETCIPAGYGVMFDDVLAGIFAAVLVCGLLFLY